MALIKEISIVIPCYNESDNLSILIENCRKILKTNKIKIEFVIVNNGSNDNTKKVLKNFNLNKNFKILHLEENFGYGNGIIEGLQYSSCKYLAWTHADLQTDISDVIRGIKHYSKDSVLVKGNRVKRGFVSKLLSLGMSFYCYVILGLWIDEINAQPKIFSKNFFQKLVSKAPKDFSIDLYLCISALKHNKIQEFSVFFKKRKYGISKGGEGSFVQKIKIIIRTIKFVNKYKIE